MSKWSGRPRTRPTANTYSRPTPRFSIRRIARLTYRRLPALRREPDASTIGVTLAIFRPSARWHPIVGFASAAGPMRGIGLKGHSDRPFRSPELWGLSPHVTAARPRSKPLSENGDGIALGTERGLIDRFVVVIGDWIVAHRNGHVPLRAGHEILEVFPLVGTRFGKEHGVGLEPQELRPRGADPTRRRRESAFSEHRGDGRGRHIDELQELPSDPEVAPPGVLPTEPKDQVLDRGIERRATGPPRAEPSLQEVSVPSRQRVRADQEAAPPVSGQESGHRRQEGPIGGGKGESPASSPAEGSSAGGGHGILEIQLIEAAADEQAEQATEEPVPDGPEHPGRTVDRKAGERAGRSADRVSLPHRPAPPCECGCPAGHEAP
jgi:hypothetical protein